MAGSPLIGPQLQSTPLGPLRSGVPFAGPPQIYDPFATPGLQLGSPDSLLLGTWAPSNPQQAVQLTGVQSKAAEEVTGGEPTEPLKTSEQVSRGLDSGASTASIVKEAARRGGTRMARRLGVLGPAVGVVGEAVALPKSISDATGSVKKAFETGSSEDITKAVGDSSAAASGATSLAKGVLEVPQAHVRNQARKAGEAAFREAAPNASKAVVNSAGKVAAEQALKEAKEKAARRAVTSAATTTAKETSTLAKGAGVAGRSAAKEVLQEGGEAAAKAATKSVAKSAAKGVAKAAGRFVPGMNIAIAGFDTAAAAATLADPKASTGKKATSVITAAGSIVAATNIPVVSQVGAAVSTVSSFIGAFF